ncbi:MAG: nucleoside deaminase [Patescibacteria group bacterium]
MDENKLAEFYRLALAEAQSGVTAGHGGPFGAVIVKDGEVVGSGHNSVWRDCDPTAHAEINALRAAGRSLGAPQLDGCVLIATSEPCPMCLAAAYWAGIKEIRFAVPLATAASVGFGDVQIYEDLAKRPTDRRIPSIHDVNQQTEGEKIFLQWQSIGGKLY